MLIVSKSSQCWMSFDSTIETIFEHWIKSNALKNAMKFFLESSKNENMNWLTFRISTTWRFILVNQISNSVATTKTSFSTTITLDSLHQMINMKCIQHYQCNSLMHIFRFVLNSNIAIILILHSLSSHHLSQLSRFVLLNLSINQFVLRISMLVSFSYLYLHLFRISMLVLHHHLWFMHQSFEIRRQSMKIIMNRHNLDSYQISARNCRNWTKSIKTMRNSRTQTTISSSS
jgi:hypothetical protein